MQWNRFICIHPSSRCWVITRSFDCMKKHYRDEYVCILETVSLNKHGIREAVSLPRMMATANYLLAFSNAPECFFYSFSCFKPAAWLTVEQCYCGVMCRVTVLASRRPTALLTWCSRMNVLMRARVCVFSSESHSPDVERYGAEAVGIILHHWRHQQLCYYQQRYAAQLCVHILYIQF